MKTHVIILIIFCLLVESPLTLAHDGHKHAPVITPEEATPIAKRMCKYLSMKDAGFGFGQLPASWRAIKDAEITIKQYDSGFYLASALNTSENKTLYILVSDKGEVHGANFTGTFAEQELKN